MKILKTYKLVSVTLLFTFSFLAVNCQPKKPVKDAAIIKKTTEITVGANSTREYLPLLKGKNVAVVANQTSVVFKSEGYTHLVDSLLAHNIAVKKVFAPEHGFRGIADAGEKINDNIDSKTGLPIISLYGNNKKPTAEQLQDIDIVVFDIQDVGVRFYTYISTLHYVMEACAESNIPLVVLDRPNPNAHYIDGPILEEAHQSFVGMHPIPIVYGMTIGEYALMINGEKWLAQNVQAELSVIKLKNYSHTLAYDLPIKPSPNLPNAKAINLYPSLCFFEGTVVSCGRGTEQQFQVFGHPNLPEDKYSFTFTPQPNIGSKNPKHNGKICYGLDLSNSPGLCELNLNWLIEAYHNFPDKNNFFNSFFTKLAGTENLQKQIENNTPVNEIKASWQPGLTKFKNKRAKYLLYN